MSHGRLTIGVPREIKPGEKRVALTPAGVSHLRQEDVRVLVEKEAGAQSGFPDEAYRKAGAEIANQADQLYREAQLIKKVKEPVRPEWPFLNSGHILFSFLHLASPENRELVNILLKQKITALGLETVVRNGRTIFLEPMSEIAGTLAAYYAGWFRKNIRVENGKIIYPAPPRPQLEKLADSYPGIPSDLPPGKAAIFGAGVVGIKAAEMLLKMGGEAVLIEKQKEKHARLREKFSSYGGRCRVRGVEEDGSQELAEADVWIGAVHVVGQRAPLVLSQESMRKVCQEKKKVILDVAVDQGGNFPETRSTHYDEPLHLDSLGNLRFGVTNIPSLCGRGASEAIESRTLPYVAALALDFKEAFRKFPELASGLQTYDGILLNEAVAKAHQLNWEPFDVSLLK